MTPTFVTVSVSFFCFVKAWNRLLQELQVDNSFKVLSQSNFLCDFRIFSALIQDQEFFVDRESQPLFRYWQHIFFLI